jgi:hypothetical protein
VSKPAKDNPATSTAHVPAPASDPVTPPPDHIRTGWVVCPDPAGDLGWKLREVELPESLVAEHTVREWPSEMMSIVLSNVEQRIGRKLVERLDT